jgi:hypothetical protein
VGRMYILYLESDRTVTWRTPFIRKGFLVTVIVGIQITYVIEKMSLNSRIFSHRSLPWRGRNVAT